MLEQLALKPSELRLHRGNVPAFLKEAQRLRATMMNEGLAVDDRLILQRLKAQWTDFYRAQPATGMLTDFNAAFVHTMATCGGQFDVLAHGLQSWIMSENSGKPCFVSSSQYCSMPATGPELLVSSESSTDSSDSGGEQLNAEEAKTEPGGEQLDADEGKAESAATTKMA